MDFRFNNEEQSLAVSFNGRFFVFQSANTHSQYVTQELISFELVEVILLTGSHYDKRMPFA